ncbi:hypothetical protein [Brevundimonas sp. A19_0]|uniref:hypothetical protein n=1 Tax=Brevundimonas sp. A19_0 TaxID=2821087 RepID=UPI001ADA47A6|nr:hypothetical protein [Brevundimonas sp. A19_0]MBO9501416.1 hypothetical protein [Brevundimonas sp. A19_0]
MTRTLTPRVRLIGAVASAIIVALAATPAMACLPEPWPQWSDIQRPGGPDLMIVRVTRIDVAETPRISSDRSELFDETVTVELVQALQGAPDAQYQMTQLHSWRPLSDEPMRCLPWRVELNVGDVVVAYENRSGALHIPQPYHVPPDLKAVLEAYQ